MANNKNYEKFYTAKIDRVFKATIANEKNKDMLEEFLSRILKKKIKIIDYLRNEHPVDTVMEKVKIVDLLVQTDEMLIHVELNNILEINLKYIQKRNFIYVATDYVSLINRGENYNKKTPILAIDLTYGIGKNKELSTTYSYQNEWGEKYIEDLETLVINMDKAMGFWYDKDEERIDENRHLIMLDCEENELKVLSRGDELVEKFKEEVTTLNNNKKFRKAMSAEKEYKMWYNTEINIAKEEGLKEGQTKIIKSLIESGMSIEKISEITNIEKEFIENLLNNDNN